MNYKIKINTLFLKHNSKLKSNYITINLIMSNGNIVIIIINLNTYKTE